MVSRPAWFRKESLEQPVVTETCVVDEATSGNLAVLAATPAQTDWMGHGVPAGLHRGRLLPGAMDRPPHGHEPIDQGIGSHGFDSQRADESLCAIMRHSRPADSG